MISQLQGNLEANPNLKEEKMITLEQLKAGMKKPEDRTAEELEFFRKEMEQMKADDARIAEEEKRSSRDQETDLILAQDAFDDLVLKLKMIEGISSTRQLSIAMGLKPEVLSQMRARGAMPIKESVDYCQKIGFSLDKLFFEVDNFALNTTYKADESSDALESSSTVQIFHKIADKTHFILPALKVSDQEARDLKAIEIEDNIHIADTSITSFCGTGSYIVKVGKHMVGSASEVYKLVKIYKKFDGRFIVTENDSIQTELDDLEGCIIVGKVIKSYFASKASEHTLENPIAFESAILKMPNVKF